MSAARLRGLAVGLLAAVTLLGAGPARAQFWRQPAPSGPPPDAKPAILEDVRIDEQLGGQVPLDVSFTDWRGQPFKLRQAFAGKRPVVLALVYYDCPMLCGLILSGMSKAFRQNGLELGRDFDAVTISFDPAERPGLAAERRRGYLQAFGKSDRGEDWPFLVGTADASRQVADAIGFHYARDRQSGEWAHMAAIFVLTPGGKISRYLYGIEFPPKDFRLAVVEAGGGRVGTSFDRLLLTCYRYDPASRKYAPYAFGFLRIGGLLTMAVLGVVIGRLFWKERARARLAPQGGSPRAAERNA